MSVERHLAEHVAGLQFDDLPERVCSAVDRLFLDTLAAILSGFANNECRGIAGTLIEAGGRSSVIGSPVLISASRAALIHGIYAHWCEWDDVHDAAGIHGSAVIFPVLFAAAELAELGRIDKDALIPSIVAAYDVAARIGRVMNAGSFHGWMTTGSAASIGAAAGAAKLLGLDEQGVLSAMGVAAAGAGLSRQALADRTTGKGILCGLAAKNAMDAAELARAGVAGAPNFLVGPFGISALHAGGLLDFEAALSDLGQVFSIAEAGIKLYPSCRSTHPSIDAVMDLREAHPDLAARVVGAEFIVPALPFSLCGRPFEEGDHPRVAAQFSIPFTAALALRKGTIAPADFQPNAVRAFAAENQELIARMAVRQADRQVLHRQETVPSCALFHLDDGGTIERRVDAIRGGPDRPLNDEQTRAKLLLAGRDVLSTSDLSRLSEEILQVRTTAELKRTLRLLGSINVR